MATATLVDIYKTLQKSLPEEEASRVISAIEVGFDAIEKRAEDVALQKKIELKEELTKELITKAEFYGEIARLEGKFEREIARLEGKFEREIARLEGKFSTDVARLEGKIENDILRLDRKFTIMFTVLFFTIIFLNQNALEFMAKVLRLIP